MAQKGDRGDEGVVNFFQMELFVLMKAELGFLFIAYYQQ